jgi:hypothetical protein
VRDQRTVGAGVALATPRECGPYKGIRESIPTPRVKTIRSTPISFEDSALSGRALDTPSYGECEEDDGEGEHRTGGEVAQFDLEQIHAYAAFDGGAPLSLGGLVALHGA